MRSRGAAAIALASPTSFWPVAVVACAGILLWRTRDWGLLGMDAFRIIENVRVQSPGDLARPFIERLAGGYNFYRPVFNLSVALDYALWGLRASGYHLTGVLFYAACAATTGLLAGRLAGRGARLAAPVAVLVVALSPLHVYVLPVIARRAELMVATFVPLAIWAQISPRALSRSRPSLLPALLALLAAGSKDNGIVAVPLCLLAVWLSSPSEDRRGRARQVLRAALPHAVLLALFFGARTAVLGGLGGFRSADPGAALAAFPARLPRMLDSVVRAAPEAVDPMLAGLLLAGCAVCLGVACTVGTRASRANAHPGRLAAVGALWMVLMLALYSLRTIWTSWYPFALLGGWALLLGAAAEQLWTLARTSSRARVPAVAGLAGLALLAAAVAASARYSPVLRRYPELDRRSAVERAFYSDLLERIQAAPARAVLPAPVPPLADPGEEGGGLAGAPQGLARSAVRAWAVLAVPERMVRVKLVPAEGRVRAGPNDDVVVVLEGARER